MGVGPDHFHGQIHKKIWNAAAKLADAGSPVNIMTVKDVTEGCGMLLNELLDQGYSPSMLGYYVPKLEETRLKRSVFLRYYNALEHFSHDMSAKDTTMPSSISATTCQPRTCFRGLRMTSTRSPRPTQGQQTRRMAGNAS
jgi:replicative DNA helicase